jgi:hypothetical protein
MFRRPFNRFHSVLVANMPFSLIRIFTSLLVELKA